MYTAFFATSTSCGAGDWLYNNAVVTRVAWWFLQAGQSNLTLPECLACVTSGIRVARIVVQSRALCECVHA